MSSILTQKDLGRSYTPHNGINRRNGSKTAVYQTLAIDILEFQFFDQMSSTLIKIGLLRFIIPP